MLLTEEHVNFAAFNVENDELKMQVKEQQEQIKKLEALVEVLMRTIHGKMEGYKSHFIFRALTREKRDN